jgi:hypothetical protein
MIFCYIHDFDVLRMVLLTWQLAMLSFSFHSLKCLQYVGAVTERVQQVCKDKNSSLMLLFPG